MYRAIQRVCNFVVKTATYKVANSLNSPVTLPKKCHISHNYMDFGAMIAYKSLKMTKSSEKRRNEKNFH